MATTGSGTSTPVTYGTTPKTLGNVVAAARNQLDDNVQEYRWSNDELTSYVDRIQKVLVVDIPLIVDRSTSSVVDVAISQGDGTVSISPLITHIEKAWIDGEDESLNIRSTAQMDVLYPTWDMATATQDVPTVLVVDGAQPDTVVLYPPLSAATGTLKMRVRRLPLWDLVYDTHVNENIELGRFAHLLIHGIMWQAYMKDDADTFDEKRAEQHRVYWEGKDGRGGDKEVIRRAVLRASHGPYTAIPLNF